jgi:hypothetical protein
MTEEKFEEVYNSVEHSFDTCEAVFLGKTKDGKVWVGQSGYYIIDREEAEKIIEVCKNYLSHIEDEQIKSYNRQLLTLRQNEPYIYPKEKVARRPTFVYLMHNNRNGLYKIGKSNNPTVREATLQSQEPEIELIFSHESSHQAERELHQIFNDKRVRGEWFKLLRTDLEFIKNYLNK